MSNHNDGLPVPLRRPWQLSYDDIDDMLWDALFWEYVQEDERKAERRKAEEKACEGLSMSERISREVRMLRKPLGQY